MSDYLKKIWQSELVEGIRFMIFILLAFLVVASLIRSSVEYSVSKDCAQYGKLTGTETAVIGLSCYSKSGARVL